MKLRTKFILFFTLLFISLAIFTAIYFNYQIQASFKEQILNNLRIIAEKNESTYFAFIGQLKTLTINWSSDNYIKELAEKIVDQSLSSASRAKAVDDFGIYLRDKKILYNKSVIIVDIINDQGIIVASNRKERIGIDEYKEETEHNTHYFSKTINAGFGEAFVRSIVFEEDESKEPMFHVTTRLFSTKLNAEGNFIPLPAVLLIHFVSLPQLVNLLWGENEPVPNRLTDEGFMQSFKTSDIYIVNKDRLLVTPTRFEPNFTYTTHISTMPVEECFQNGREMTGEYINYRGSPVFVSAMCLIDDGLVLIKEISTKEAYELFNSLQQKTIALGSIFFAIIIIITLFIMYKLVHRIDLVSIAVKKISHGDFAVKVPDGGSDEISELAKSFNIMTLKLRDLYQNLEHKVVERTRLLKLDKAKIEALLQSIGEGIIATNEHGNITKINHAAEKMLKWEEGEVLGKIFTEIIPAYNEKGEIIPQNDRALSITLARGVPASLLASFERKDGTRFPVSALVTPIIFEGRLVGATAAFRDVTKEKEIEKTRHDFLSLASHQFRTPLSGTKWLIETMQRGIIGKLTDKQKRYIDQLYIINERMIKLVSDMLGVLRLNADTAGINLEFFSVAEFYNDFALSVEIIAKTKGIQIKKLFDDRKALVVYADRELLKTILECFISNAINYSSAGQEVIFDAKEDNGNVVFSVKDFGIGIPEEEQNRIFEQFYRASNAKLADPEGNGLGLHISRTLARKMGAEISFESEKGKGTIFYLQVPQNSK